MRHHGWFGWITYMSSVSSVWRDSSSDTSAYPDILHFALRGDGPCHINQAHARNLRHENLPAMHLLKTLHHKPDALFECDPEARHARVGHRDLSPLTLLLKNRNDAAAASQYVSVASAAEPRILRAGIGIGLHEHLLSAQLRRAVKVDGIHRLVSAQRQNPLHTMIDGGINHVAPAHDVGLDRLKWVVLARWNLLHRRGMHHHGYS